MKKLAMAATLAIGLASTPLSGQPSAQARYTTAGTPIGTLLTDPAARAVLARRFPVLLQSKAVTSGRANRFTLRTLKRFKPAIFTDTALAGADADLPPCRDVEQLEDQLQ